jgi:hypothetical protein
MVRNIAIWWTILGIASHGVAGPVTNWSPTNDPAVAYRWSVDDAWRPDCEVHIADASPSQAKRVSISYRNQAGFHISLTVRMNSGDPYDRLIPGCVAVDEVSITRR